MKAKSKFIIGDIQGCYKEFKNLIKLIDPNKENKFFCVGDLVNRGPESEKVLDYVLENNIQSVLGNHDLHLMAILIGAKKHNKKKDTMIKILNKNKAVEIIDYFSCFPFAKIISTNNKKTLVTHAGVLPSWTLEDTLNANEELTDSLKRDPEGFFSTMYSDRSKAISKSTNKKNRRRYLINVFTRMRFLSSNNKLDLQTKIKKSGSKKFQPWFSYEHKCLNDVENIVFGHWAALNGVTNHNNIKGIDLGCVWGGSLAAININDKSIITVDSQK
ncbi:MAG: symmetrical bis(5'-nucleosyl)-tetraphosphatase [Gammaproteobacteria bacterium]|jgi:bis(5'-nucleosyl)-tetraphosphatase (symmetrical)|nr:symmetrical bis(5'-nucleosyl)-tetraphosphatase [Gammaproteobacteria bacterium]|tara:strand:+ start:331 stop:1149 length:819 start_codon:yes stop_codon:yes gene_type:complete